jgi:hypothetical protein
MEDFRSGHPLHYMSSIPLSEYISGKMSLRMGHLYVVILILIVIAIVVLIAMSALASM